MNTKDKILNRMLTSLPTDYDKTEGGLFFDTLSPISFEIEEVYKYLDMRFKNTFPETAEGEYLDLIVKEIDIHRKGATHSVGVVKISGVEGTVVPKGTKINSDSFIYETTEEKIINGGSVNIPARSVEKGSKYNVPAGAIKFFPITIPNLNSVINEEPFIDGYDTESDGNLLERYLTKIREPQTSGNIYDYKKWAKEVEGVGDVKVFPLWNGNGTVKVAIISDEKLPADEELRKRAENYINEYRPIGANVTVVSADALNISITVSVKVGDEVNQEELKEKIHNSIQAYIKKIAFTDKIISFAKIGYQILSVNRVLDYKDLNINGSSSQTNITIPDTSIAVLSSIEIDFYKE